MARPPKSQSSPQSERSPLGPVEITEMRNSAVDPRSERQTTRPPPGSELPSAALPSLPPGRGGAQSRLVVPRPADLPGPMPAPAPVPSRVSSLVPGDRELVSTARLHRQIAQLQEQLADMQRDLSLTNQERAAEAERYDELSVQVITLQRANAELEGRVLAGQEAEDALKQREAELDREVSMLRESLQQRVRDDMKRLEAEKESIDASQRALEEQRLAFEAKLVDRDLELARLRGEVVVTKELKATRSRELQAVRATADAFDAKVREAETVSQGLRNELDHARAEIGRLSSDQDALRDEVARKKAEIEALASVKATLLALVDGLDRLGADTRGLRTEAAAALEAVAEARQSARPPAKVSDAPKPAAADEDAPEVLAADIIEDDAGDRPTSVGEAPPEPPPAEAKADEAPPAEAKADSAKADEASSDAAPPAEAKADGANAAEAKAADAKAADANADGGDKPWFEPKDADAAGDGATDSDWPSE